MILKVLISDKLKWFCKLEVFDLAYLFLTRVNKTLCKAAKLFKDVKHRNKSIKFKYKAKNQ